MKLNKTDIHNNIMLARDSLTLPFKNAVMKMPAAVRNMEWGEYLVSSFYYISFIISDLIIFLFTENESYC